MAERPDSETLRALENRRAESTRAILLAPLLALLAQPFLLVALGNENVGWLARLAVLTAAWGVLLAAVWTVLRSRAREAQLESELEAAGIEARPEGLPRPRHHEPAEPPPPAPGVTGLAPPPPREPVTPKLEAALAPETDEEALPEETGERPLASETDEDPLPGTEPLTPPSGAPPSEAGEMRLPEDDEGEAETEIFGAEGETELIEEPSAPAAETELIEEPAPADSAAAIEEGEPQEDEDEAAEGSRGRRRSGRPKREREPWVRRWDHHVVWWASGPEHARPYMAWVLALGLFAVADLAVFLATI